jgi:hypothetical protein
MNKMEEFVSMAGKRGRSGRRKGAGKVYQFFFYYRFNPAEDPPELADLLKALTQAKGRKRRDILRTALLGGAQQAQDTAGRVEDSEIAGALDELCDDF